DADRVQRRSARALFDAAAALDAHDAALVAGGERAGRRADHRAQRASAGAERRDALAADLEDQAVRADRDRVARAARDAPQIPGVGHHRAREQARLPAQEVSLRADDEELAVLRHAVAQRRAR